MTSYDIRHNFPTLVADITIDSSPSGSEAEQKLKNMDNFFHSLAAALHTSSEVLSRYYVDELPINEAAQAALQVVAERTYLRSSRGIIFFWF
jgi:hypothetical protein